MAADVETGRRFRKRGRSGHRGHDRCGGKDDARKVLLQAGYRRMRDMAGRLVTLLLLWMVGVAAGTEDLGTIDITISKSTDGFSVTLDWNLLCLESNPEVTFTAFYKKIGIPDSEPQGCVFTDKCSCEIPSKLLDVSQSYTLLVFATTPEGKTLSSSQDFDANRKLAPPPDVRVMSSDALVIVDILIPDIGSKGYNIILRKNDSSEEKSTDSSDHTYIIPPNDLLPEQTYCVKVNVFNKRTMEPSAYSPEQCFTAPADGPPNNLRMEALDSRYLLKWDWDFNQSPNVTFSVEKCLDDGRCTKIKGCENITTTQCYCLELYFVGSYILRASVYDSQREEKSSSVIQFTPYQDTLIGPPKDLKMRIVDNELYIDVTTPEGFRNTDIYNLCTWQTHLEYWTNSMHNSEVTVKEDPQPFFKIDSLKASTTYCAKAKMKCLHSNRSSLYSEDYCITTDPRSYLVAWITGCTFLGIVMISVILYIVFCPLKRYIKHTFFPSCKLPSSIEKGFGESTLDSSKHPFLSHEEEAMERCYIVQNSHTDLVQINFNNTSKANNQDSGNYSNDGQATGETVTYTP